MHVPVHKIAKVTGKGTSNGHDTYSFQKSGHDTWRWPHNVQAIKSSTLLLEKNQFDYAIC